MRKRRFLRAQIKMAAGSAITDSHLNDGGERNGETNVEGKVSYPLYCDRTSRCFIKGNMLSSRDTFRIEICLFRPKLHIFLVYNDQSSLSVV